MKLFAVRNAEAQALDAVPILDELAFRRALLSQIANGSRLLLLTALPKADGDTYL